MDNTLHLALPNHSSSDRTDFPTNPEPEEMDFITTALLQVAFCTYGVAVITLTENKILPEDKFVRYAV